MEEFSIFDFLLARAGDVVALTITVGKCAFNNQALKRTSQIPSHWRENPLHQFCKLGALRPPSIQ